jgi:phosphoribosyl-ATP pyrophosphohydrolase
MSQSMGKDVLSRLAAIIKSRRKARPEDSHTRRLLDEAPLKPAKKLGEEAVEVAIAAIAQDRKALVGETADMLYHLLVLLESREVTLDEVFDELERRMALTAVGEKRQKTASR